MKEVINKIYESFLNQFSKSQNRIAEICVIIRIIAAIIILSLYGKGFIYNYILSRYLLLQKSLLPFQSSFLYSTYFTIIITFLWILTEIKIVRCLIVCLPYDKDFAIPLSFTIENMVDIIFSSHCLLLVLNIFLSDNSDKTNSFALYISAFYCIWVVFKKIYVLNSNKWYRLNRHSSYTGYYFNGKPICNRDKFIYKNKVYIVTSIIENVGAPLASKETKIWYLIPDPLLYVSDYGASEKYSLERILQEEEKCLSRIE